MFRAVEELIFFPAPGTGLCFGLVLKRVLMTIQRCFQYCWAVLTQSQGLFCSSPHSTSEEAGVHKELEMGTARTTDPGDIPGHMSSCSAINWGRGWCMAIAQGQAGHSVVGGEQLFSFTSLLSRV